MHFKEVTKAIFTTIARCQIIRKHHIYSPQCRSDSYPKLTSLIIERKLQLMPPKALAYTGIRCYQKQNNDNNNDLLTYQCPFCSYTFEGVGFKPWLLQEHLQHCRKAREHQRRENLKKIIEKILKKRLNIQIKKDCNENQSNDLSGPKDSLDDIRGQFNLLNLLNDDNEYPEDFNDKQYGVDNKMDNSLLIDSKSYIKSNKKYPIELKYILNSLLRNEVYKDIQIQDIFNEKDLIEPYILYDKTGKNKSYVCLQCGYENKRESVIRQHLLIHTGEKPFHCTKCGKGFASQAEVTRHMITHKREKPFKCPYCDKKFNKQINLTSHIKSNHLGERPYACSECGKKFPTTQQLNNHKLIHSGEKPYACSFCDYKSTQKSNLKRHMRKHTNKKPHHCPYCDFQTTRSDNLNSHIKKFHDNVE